ncbi:hypothetical protein KUM42_12080 [Modestobacter sp. L9-4]|uniref:hypothetical protein n=1 Tax=Modestobacter sp. L9-4 TaxID=2851567 RepID=UPI001C742545|nr:hypothetical protein [Modestobacter sp. L9-4]QXG74625.1 hypothetical protein KUM42_12080 [Modestobacter sp. L9-4]
MQGEQTLSWSPGAAVEWLRRFWPTLVAGILLGCALGFVHHELSSESYRATTQLVVGPSSVDAVLPSATNAGGDARLAQATQAGVLRSEQVRQAAEQTLGTPVEVSVTVVKDSQLIEVSAVSTTPERAVAVADTYVDGYLQLSRQQAAEAFSQLEVQLRASADSIGQQLATLDAQTSSDQVAGGSSTSAQSVARLNLQTRAFQINGALANVEVLSQSPPAAATVTTTAATPETPIGLSASAATVLGGLLGLMLATVLSAAWNVFAAKLQTQRQVEELTGLSFVAVVAQNGNRYTVEEGGLLAGLLARTSGAVNGGRLALVMSPERASTPVAEALAAFVSERTADNHPPVLNDVGPEQPVGSFGLDHSQGAATPQWRFDAVVAPDRSPSAASSLVRDYDAAVLVVDARRSTRRGVTRAVKLLDELDIPTLGMLWSTSDEKAARGSEQ